MRVCSLALLSLVSLLATPLAAAPAPFPRLDRASPAEAVLAAGTAQRASLAQEYLRSRLFLKELLRSPEVRAIPGLARAKDGQTWLRERLKVTEGPTGGLVRVRVSGCAHREALLLLRAALSRVTRPTTEDSVKAAAALRRNALRQVLVMRRMRALGPRGAVSREELEDARMLELSAEFATRPLRIHQAPL
jgi:hypothetical protein